MVKLRVIGAVLAIALASCTTTPGTTRVPLAASAQIGQAGTILAFHRANAGLPDPVTQHPALQAAAQAHADDLAPQNGLSHTGRDGSSLSDRIRRTGYTACFAAENIARGQPNVQAVFASWAGSDGHYRNMVNPAAEHYGFARAGDAWVLVLARPC